jgi:hypothetical protein
MPHTQAEPSDKTARKRDFARRCHVGAIALRVAAERLEILSREPARIDTAHAGLTIDAMSCAAQSCQELIPELLDADIERRTR